MTTRPVRSLTAVALSLALLTGAATGARANDDTDDYTMQVIDQLTDTTATAANAGYALLDAASDRLYTGDWHQKTLYLEAGREYRIAGACDDDCRDMDLALYDAEGREIARDARRDDRPAVSVRVRREGEYTLAVAIPDCRAGRCTYGIALYGRPLVGKPRI